MLLRSLVVTLRQPEFHRRGGNSWRDILKIPTVFAMSYYEPQKEYPSSLVIVRVKTIYARIDIRYSIVLETVSRSFVIKNSKLHIYVSLLFYHISFLRRKTIRLVSRETTDLKQILSNSFNPRITACRSLISNVKSSRA